MYHDTVSPDDTITSQRREYSICEDSVSGVHVTIHSGSDAAIRALAYMDRSDDSQISDSICAVTPAYRPQRVRIYTGSSLAVSPDEVGLPWIDANTFIDSCRCDGSDGDIHSEV